MSLSGTFPSDVAGELAAYGDALSRLARTLIRDGDDADDVAQEAWLAVVRHPPAPGRAPGPYLAAIARNAGRMLWRSRSRRARWEEAAAANTGDATVPGPDDVAE